MENRKLQKPKEEAERMARKAAQAVGDNQEGTSQIIANPESEKQLDDQAVIHEDDVKES